MNAQIVVKIVYNNELRRLAFQNLDDLRYHHLQEKLRLIFGLSYDPKISYTDDGGSQRVIKEEQDLYLATEFFKKRSGGRSITIRLVMETVEPEQKPFELEPSRQVPLESGSSQTPRTDPFFHTNASNVGTFPATLPTFPTFISTSAATNLPGFQPTASPPIPPVLETNPTFSLFSQPSMVDQLPEGETTSGVVCNLCQNTITGRRYECHSCPKFNLCNSCKSSNPYHPQDHRFIIQHQPPGHNIPSYSVKPVAPVIHPAQCDYCFEQIQGIRYKCYDCPDFDLCQQCIAQAPKYHANHTFRQILKADGPEVILQTAFLTDGDDHVSVRCNGCGRWIRGIRYKCVNCLNFDFCSDCEAKEQTEHDPTHLFLKIKKPLLQTIPMQRPLLPNMYKTNLSASRTPTQFCQSCDTHPTSSPTKSPSLFPSDHEHSNNPSSSSNSVPPKDLQTRSTNTLVTEKEVKATQTNEIQMEDATSVPNFLSLPPSPSVIKPNIISMSTIGPISIPSARKEFALDAQFSNDVNIPDGTVMQPQARFRKIWKVTNNGAQSWPMGTKLKFMGGHRMFAQDQMQFVDTEAGLTFEIPVTDPDVEAFVTADLQAPVEPGQYTSYWRFVDVDGQEFGDRLWCTIQVKEDVKDLNHSLSSITFPVINTNSLPSQLSSLPSTPRSESSHPALTEDPFQDPSNFDSSIGLRTPVDSPATSIHDGEDTETDDVISSFSSPTPFAEGGDYVMVEKEDDELHHDTPQENETNTTPMRPRSPAIGQIITDDEEGTRSELEPLITGSLSMDEASSSFLVERDREPIETVTQDDQQSITEDLIASGTNTPPAVVSDAQSSIAMFPHAHLLPSLREMGFFNEELNLNLLEAFNGNLELVIAELIGTTF